MLIFVKNNSVLPFFTNLFKSPSHNGLVYNDNTTVSDLINRDTDGDGIPDWEERLWGTDPTKADTVPGVPDSVTIEKLKAAQLAASGQTINETDNQSSTNLTPTDKFSRELFSTISTLSENGTMDQATIDKISSTLENNIQNSPQRKVYTLADIIITKDDSLASIKKYAVALDNLTPKTPLKYTALDVLDKFAPSNTDTVDPTVLPELDPIISGTNSFVTGMTKIPVPDSLASEHLDVLNILEGLNENLNDIELYDTDPITALAGVSKYYQNSANVVPAMQKLADTINEKLKS